MKFGVLVFLGIFSFAGVCAPSVPPLLRDRVRQHMNNFVIQQRENAVKLADKKPAMRELLNYYRLREEDRQWGASVRDQDAGGRQKLVRQEIAFLEKRIIFPARDSHDGRLLMRLLYVEQAVPIALERFMERVASDHVDLADETDILDIERRATSLLDEIAELERMRVSVIENEGLMSEADAQRVQVTAEKISLIYERFLLETSRMPASLTDKLLAITASGLIDGILIGSTIYVAGTDPQNILAWLGLVGAGFAMKTAQAVVWADFRNLIPVWGIFARADKIVTHVRERGHLSVQQYAVSMSGIESQDWEVAEATISNQCVSLLLEVTDALANEAVYPPRLPKVRVYSLGLQTPVLQRLR